MPEQPPSAQSTVERERDVAILERDEMRRANITPEDADRPYGQSVEYWQDRCLDHATALDNARRVLRGIKSRCDRIVAGEFGGIEAALEISNEIRRALASDQKHRESEDR